MTQVTFGDVKANINDLLQNYQATTIDEGAVDRGANRAIEYVQRRLGLPSDKKFFSFYYYDDIKFQACPEGFNELLQVNYNIDNGVDKNFPINRWNIVKDLDIYNDSAGVKTKNRVASTTINGTNQLVFSASNVKARTLFNSFDSLSGLTFSSNVSNQAVDLYTYYQGLASIKFDMSASLTSTTISFTGLWDIRTALQFFAAYRLRVMFPTGKTSSFSNVEVRLNSASGYYTANTTNQADGTDWTSDEWNLLSFTSPTTSGTVDPSQITSISVIFNHAVGFTPVTGLRIDYLYQVIPDLLNCIYYTAFKGTDSLGTTPKVVMDQDGDILSFGSYAPDLVDVIALRAALRLFPQLRGDLNFWQMYKADCDDVLKLLSRTYPRQRASQSGSTHLYR